LKLLVAVTGASGVIYGKRLLEVLDRKNIDAHLIVSNAAKLVLAHELEEENITRFSVKEYSSDELDAPFASGSYNVDCMIIVPASMKTVGALSSGYTENLITRAADVQLKERRKLIIVPRETPLHAVHLENLTKLARLGAIIIPAMPGFYHKPENIGDLVDFIVGKILDQIGIDHNLYERWN